jgi:hypothetical protein
MPAKKHVHRYERTVLGRKGYIVWRCNLPDCSHYIADKLVKGKRTVCNRCGTDMLMDTRAMNLVRPHCVDCIETKKSDTHDALLEFVEAREMSKREP